MYNGIIEGETRHGQEVLRDAEHVGIVEGIFFGWEKIHRRIVKKTVEENEDDRQIMKQNADRSYFHPFVMKNENVPFHNAPSEENSVSAIETPIAEGPDRTKHLRSFPLAFGTIPNQHPWITCQLTEETDRENNDWNVIVQCTTCLSIRNQTVKNETTTNNGRNPQGQEDPESHLV